MSDLDDNYNSLISELAELDKLYIAKYIPADPATTPAEYEYDVKAFCIFSHAAFEEFVEAISEYAMEKIISDFYLKKYSLSTCTFLMSYSDKFLPEEEGRSQDRCFDIIRKSLEDCKAKHSKNLKDNHGFSLYYLRSILTPVGIDIPDGLHLNSLKKLSDARGSYAHTRAKLALYGGYKRATTPMAPEDAKGIVCDCISLSQRLKEQAKTI